MAGKAVQNLIIQGLKAKWQQISVGALCAALSLLALFVGVNTRGQEATAALPNDTTHLGVASCGGTTCHGRSQPDGRVVRQDEIMRWQEASSVTGSHSRALAILSSERSGQIARKLGIGSAPSAQMCLGCHAEPTPAVGPRFQRSDGIGCEACHGGAANWIEVHKTGNHPASLAAGLVKLESPKVRASVCLDCHFGSADKGQFVTHQIMAAGHPRISFELDLFSTLQAHHNEDVDYASRKGRSNGVRFWAVGQAMAVERSLSLYTNPGLGTDGAFPEFYFFDCHSCHRKIYDAQNFTPTVIDNPGRPLPPGFPPYNDENMIMLSAAARVAAPGLGQRFDADSRAFHAAIAKDRPSALAAAAKLRASANALAQAFESAEFGRAQTFAMIDSIGSNAISPRFTDYEGSVQAVMAIDTLLNSLVNAGQVSEAKATTIRGEVNRAYAAVKEPNDFRQGDFKRALGSAVQTIRNLR
jgi:Cytochrome c554 and c-prime